MSDVRYERPTYPHGTSWAAGSLDALEAEMLPIIKLLLNVLP